ncbi:hypothetical protein MLD38_022764 [Melastoma candidum]|uniref:Uncharacterized protein n=1 Tax=Melastoma candidum TaxID=119954 RepID=A0ACB9QJQ4_9MYRT|nr:hypothetical protein MLD38_022764 [Melastoma candidum]
MKVSPESAIKFYAYEMPKNVIVYAKGGDDKAEIGAGGCLLAGGLAGAIAQTAVYPMDLVKTRLQTHACEGGKVPSIGSLSRDILVQEGPRAFYREPGPLVQLGCGTISGALGATCVYPLLVVRTRMQAQSVNDEGAYKGMSDVFRRTFRNEVHF